MKLKSLFLLCFFVSFSAFAQSKKQQIEDLNVQFDSILSINAKIIENNRNLSKKNLINQSELIKMSQSISEYENSIKRLQIKVSLLIKQSDSLRNENEHLRNDIDSIKLLNEKLVITSDSVGGFVLGNGIPFIDGFELIRMEETRYGEEASSYIFNWSDVFYANEKLMEVEINSSGTIAVISVVSPKIVTSEGIGVGSTINDFIEAYPNYQIWWSYISDMCVIESNDHDFQCILNYGDLNLAPTITGDRTLLNKGDFSTAAQIERIRLFTH